MPQRRPLVRAVFVAAVVAAPVFVGVPPTHADVFFRASAIADGLNTIVGGAGVPFGAVTEGGSPAAQAVLDSVGNSKGYAANPYPGDFAVSLPGTVAGVLPIPAPVPGYPAFVTSDSANQPEAHADYAAYTLSSTSDDVGTHATATEGDKADDEGYAVADAQTRVVDGSGVHVMATSTVDAFAVPGVLSFGTVTTTAEITRAEGSKPQVKSSIEVWGVTVAGQPVGFRDGHFVAPGTDQPLPADPLDGVLGQAGVSVRYVGAERLPNGIASPAVEVTITQEAPAGNPASGQYKVTHVLGRSIATLDVNGRAAAATPTAPGGGVGATHPGTTSGGGTAATGQPSGPVGSSAPDLGNAGTSGTAESNGPPEVASAPQSGTPGPAALAASMPGHVETVDIYLAIVVAAAFLAVSSQLVRSLGSNYGWR